MATFIAYCSVVLIWATTPLAIQLSSHSLSAFAAVLVRMVIALALALVINALLRRKLFTHPQQWKIYAAASISLFPNLPVVYWAAQFIPSGLVAVIFSLSPFVTGLLAWGVLKENPFNVKRLLALLIAFVGVVIIFCHQMQFDDHSVWGVAGILVSCFLFGLSSVLVKKFTAHLPTASSAPASPAETDAFNTVVGSLLFSLPGLLVCWWLLDGTVPSAVSDTSAYAVVYLAIMGSLVGAVLFFYILRRLSASVVSLVTLMTPLLALMIGKWGAAESLSFQTALGVGTVLLALFLYMPWRWSACRTWLAVRMQRALLRPALGAKEYPESSLQDARDKAMRFK